MPQREINAVALFRIQVRIADIENENARMRAIVIKLFESGGAERMLIVSDKRAASPERHAHTRRSPQSCACGSCPPGCSHSARRVRQIENLRARSQLVLNQKRQRNVAWCVAPGLQRQSIHSRE